MPKKSEHALALFHAHVGIEIWKHVHDFPFVEVSNLGRVRRWWKSIGYRIINGRDMKGYLSIRINDKNFFIHRLVAKTFIPNPYNKKSVDHVVSSEKCNNKLTNLRWATPKEQNYNRKTSNFGINNRIGVICLDKITNQFIKKFVSLQEALSWLGKDCRCGTHITNVCRKNPKYKSAYGYKWEYDQEMCIKGEEWKDISSMNGEYQISNYGRLYHKTNNRIMNNSVTRDGYIRVSIEKYKCRELVHRLVAKAFIQNPEPNIKLQVNHKNMDRSNCCVNNLEWVTCSENILHSYKHRKV